MKATHLGLAFIREDAKDIQIVDSEYFEPSGEYEAGISQCKVDVLYSRSRANTSVFNQLSTLGKAEVHRILLVQILKKGYTHVNFINENVRRNSLEYIIGGAKLQRKKVDMVTTQSRKFPLDFLKDSGIRVISGRVFTPSDEFIQTDTICKLQTLYIRPWESDKFYSELNTRQKRNLHNLLSCNLHHLGYTHVHYIVEGHPRDGVVNYTVSGAKLIRKPLTTGHKLDYNKVIKQYKGVSIVSVDGLIIPIRQLKSKSTYMSLYNSEYIQLRAWDWRIAPGSTCLLSKDGVKYEKKVLGQVMPTLIFKDSKGDCYSYIKPLDPVKESDRRICIALLEDAQNEVDKLTARLGKLDE